MFDQRGDLELDKNVGKLSAFSLYSYKTFSQNFHKLSIFTYLLKIQVKQSLICNLLVNGFNTTDHME